jgi:hypothetical protein
MSRSGEQVRGRSARGSLERADLTRGGVQPSSEAGFCQRGAVSLKRGGASPEGVWANCFGGPLGPLGSRLCCVCFGLANFVCVCVLFFTKENEFLPVL